MTRRWRSFPEVRFTFHRPSVPTRRYSGDIYEASFGSSIDQLFVDGERMRAARYPDSGYFPISSVETSTRFTADDLDSSIDWQSATGQDASSSFDGTPLGATETIELFYNDTKSDKTWSVGGAVARDVDGDAVTGSFTLRPFTSIILIGENLRSITAP